MTYNILFKNWEKNQPRDSKRQIRPWWFALKNDFHKDPKMQKFTMAQRAVISFLLCECSQQNKKGACEVELSTFSRQTGAKVSLIKSTIEDLISRDICADLAPRQEERRGEEKREDKNTYVNIEKPKSSINKDLEELKEFAKSLDGGNGISSRFFNGLCKK